MQASVSFYQASEGCRVVHRLTVRLVQVYHLPSRDNPSIPDHLLDTDLKKVSTFSARNEQAIRGWNLTTQGSNL